MCYVFPPASKTPSRRRRHQRPISRSVCTWISCPPYTNAVVSGRELICCVCIPVPACVRVSQRSATIIGAAGAHMMLCVCVSFSPEPSGHACVPFAGVYFFFFLPPFLAKGLSWSSRSTTYGHVHRRGPQSVSVRCCLRFQWASHTVWRRRGVRWGVGECKACLWRCLWRGWAGKRWRK